VCSELFVFVLIIPLAEAGKCYAAFPQTDIDEFLKYPDQTKGNP
jgi:hypothetical protein